MIIYEKNTENVSKDFDKDFRLLLQDFQLVADPSSMNELTAEYWNS